MQKIAMFNHVSADGFFAGSRGEIDWLKAVKKDKEWDAYSHEGAKSGGTLLFGRTTYEMMKSFWPTPAAVKMDPRMADIMNDSPKVVFSGTLNGFEEGSSWNNVEVRPELNEEEILRLKAQKGPGITVLGSGTIVRQLSNLSLIDEYCLVVVPIVLGAGKPLFEGVKEMPLKLIESRDFRNGLAVHRYKPAK